MEFPAVADFACTTALVEAAGNRLALTHVGVTASSTLSIRVRNVTDTYSGRVVRRFKGSIKWQAMGVMNYEMESATLSNHVRKPEGLRAGNSGGRYRQPYPTRRFRAETMKQTETARGEKSSWKRPVVCCNSPLFARRAFGLFLLRGASQEIPFKLDVYTAQFTILCRTVWFEERCCGYYSYDKRRHWRWRPGAVIGWLATKAHAVKSRRSYRERTA